MQGSIVHKFEKLPNRRKQRKVKDWKWKRRIEQRQEERYAQNKK